MQKRSMFRGALMLTAVNLLLRLVSTSFQVYLSGRIGASGIGLLQLVLSVGALAMTAGMAGIRTATMYLTAEELGKKQPGNVVWVLSGCFLYSILFSGAAALTLYHFAPALAQNWIGDLRALPTVRLYAAFVPVCCLCGVMTGYFTAANRIGTLAAVEIAEQLLSMIATVVILSVWAGHDPGRSCQAVVFGSGAGACLTLTCLIVLRLRDQGKPAKRIPIRSRLLQTATPLALADDLRAGISTTENLMVPKRLSLYSAAGDPLAAFGTVCGMVFPVLTFPMAILFGLNELLIPELARCNAAGSRQRIEYLSNRCLRVALLYGCAFCGLEFLLAKPLCMALYGSEEAGRWLQFYALMIPMLYCDAVTDAMTKGLGQQKACVRYNILTSAMDVGLLFLWLPKYGMTGYLLSFFITHLLNFILSLRRLLKITGKGISISCVLLAGLATGFAVWCAGWLQQPVAVGVGFVAIFISLLFLFRVVGKEDVLWLKNLIKK